MCTRSPKSYRPERRNAVEGLIERLKESGVGVKTRENLLYRYAVIDQSIVWYGNIEYLSYNAADANALRFESPDTAGELMDLWEKEAQSEHLPEQLHLEEPV